MTGISQETQTVVTTSRKPKKGKRKTNMAHIIGIIQVKGGAGRSTVATNIAGLIAENKRKSVALIDCDMPQGTSASWAAIRRGEDASSDITIATAANHVELVEQVQRLDADHDFIVIDAPPRIAEITKAAMILSHLSLIPVGASAPDVWATSDLLPTIAAAKAHKPDVDARIVWNRFRNSTRLAHELEAEANQTLGLKQMESKLGYRVAYAEAIARGMTVSEWSDKVAKNELLSLAKEIQRVMKVKFLKDR